MRSQRHSFHRGQADTQVRTILFIVENNTVPPDIRVWREARTAKQAGYGVVVISPKNSTYAKSYEVIEGIEIYRHPSLALGEGKINQVIEYGNAFFWEAVLSLRVFFKKRFHVIHGANPPDHLFLIGLLFRAAGVRYIFDHHDLAAELYVAKFNGRKGLVYRVLSLMEKMSCATADAVITTNQSYRDYVIEKHGTPPEKISIVRNDPEVPAPHKGGRAGEPKRPKINLLYIGSINRQDGLDLLLRAVHILVNQLDQRQVHCTVIGDGDDLPRVKALCAKWSLDAFISFTGYIYDRAKIRACIEEADICLECAPASEANSRSTFIKIMEYMAAGKPIVAFDLQETRYSAQASALLVEPGNLKAFAAAVEKLIREPSLREKLGTCGRNRIIHELNWENSATALRQIYAQVLRGRHEEHAALCDSHARER